MTIKIDERIVACEVVGDGASPPMPALPQPYARPTKMRGTTYKVKPPTMEAALYITINDLDLPDGSRRPFEIFLNSKDVTNSQWMVAVTRLLSGHFRQPTDFLWAIDELKQVYDPKGSYFIPGGGGSCGGIVAHIARVLEEHCRDLGLIQAATLTEERKQELAAKRTEADARGAAAKECPKCHEQSMFYLDGCWTCTSCGESKCG